MVGSRGSPLALAQTRQICADLERAWPDERFVLQIIRTTGDDLSENPQTNQPMSKGLFTGELERALLSGEIDLAVHSLKDLPTQPTNSGLEIAAMPNRADARDVLVTREPIGMESFPPNALFATGSPRRSAQLRLIRADFQDVAIRGNIDTRLRKFREHLEWSALVLAAAGLTRLQPDLAGLTVTRLPYSMMLPAPGQGALGLQTRGSDRDIKKILRVLHHEETELRVNAERAFLHALGGGCLQPIAAHAQITREGELKLEGIAWLNNEPQPRRGERTGALEEPVMLGLALAQDLRR